MNLKPFDVEIDRALKALQLYVRMAAFFGAKLHVLPGHRRDVCAGVSICFTRAVRDRAEPQRLIGRPCRCDRFNG